MAFEIKKPHKGTETKWYRVFCYPVTIFEIKKPHKGTETDLTRKVRFTVLI